MKKGRLFLLLLPGILVTHGDSWASGFLAPKDNSICIDAVRKVDVVAAERSTHADVHPLLANASIDMIRSLQEVAVSIFDMGESNNEISDWSIRAVPLLRDLGVPESEVSKMVGERLDLFSAFSVEAGIPAGPPAVLLQGESAQQDFEATGNPLVDFSKKYSLDKIERLRTYLGSDLGSTANMSYLVNLSNAYELADLVGDHSRAQRAFFQLLQTDNFETAIKIADEMNDDQLLLDLSLFIITKIIHGEKRYYLNNISSAIDALQRVQGPQKEIANGILIDFAELITSTQFLNEGHRRWGTSPASQRGYEHSIYMSALHALRSTGRLVERVRTSSGSVFYRTRVEDVRAKEAINRILDHLTTVGVSRPSLEIYYALEAIGAHSGRIQSFGDYVTRFEGYPRNGVVLDDRDTNEAISENQSSHWLQEADQWVSRGFEPLSESHLELERKKAIEKLESNEYWGAYIIYKNIRDIEGLITVTNALIDSGDSFRAIGPLLYATILSSSSN